MGVPSVHKKLLKDRTQRTDVRKANFRLNYLLNLLIAFLYNVTIQFISLYILYSLLCYYCREQKAQSENCIKERRKLTYQP